MINYPDFSAYNYRVINELGRNREGGRISYLAERVTSEQKPKQQVVIKQFRFLQADTSWQGFKAYEREIKILQELNHPRIPQYLDSFETSEGFCMVQEYKNAPSLATKSNLFPEDIQAIAISVLEILVYLQSRSPAIIHRDLKPENILIDNDNNAYLIDFGLSKIGGTEVAISSIVAGTPGYMPPEELFNRPLTEASDLYSLGATLIGLLTNMRSTEISNLIDTTYRFNFKHLLTHLNPKFTIWLTKMVEPNLKDRYLDARSALTALQSINIDDRSHHFTFNKSWLGIGSIFLATLAGTYIQSIRFNNSSQTQISQQNLNNNSTTVSPPNLSTEEEWFERIKPHCNALEIITELRSYPPPNTTEGYAYAASCYALAGKIKQADELIQELPENSRPYAAGILFNIGHPIADAGDDESAGSIMRLVLKYWTDNYMAMYHAGMSEYAVGDLQLSKQHLEQFLVTYQNDDVWRQKATFILDRINKNMSIDSEPKLDPTSLSRH
jgi:serine/threonine protein kinase